MRRKVALAAMRLCHLQTRPPAACPLVAFFRPGECKSAQFRKGPCRYAHGDVCDGATVLIGGIQGVSRSGFRINRHAGCTHGTEPWGNDYIVVAAGYIPGERYAASGGNLSGRSGKTADRGS